MSRQHSKKSLLDKIKRLFILLSLFFILSFAVICGWFLYFPIISKHDLHYIFKENTSAYSFASDLNQQANLTSPQLFRIIVRLRGESKKLKAGEYLFPVGSTSLDVLKQVVNENVVYHAFTIINGWNYYKVLSAFDKTTSIQHTLQNHNALSVAKQMKIEYKSPEGLLYPETYYYTLGTTDIELMQRAYNTMQKYLQKAWNNRAQGLPYKNAYSALIVASMIEKEASIQNEKPIIAGIILNRLKKWMPLQIDPTVIYGLGKNFTGDLTRKDLRTKTPYNTYTNYGLPPTPIAMPGPGSIQAALHPAKTNYMYFVATKDGGHVFSKTLDKHKQEVVKYQINKDD